MAESDRGIKLIFLTVLTSGQDAAMAALLRM
jgi:hypothetical protein